MNKRCKHVKQDGFTCGSYAFNLYMDDIDQGDLCDVHYWQAKAQRTWVGLTDELKAALWESSRAGLPRFHTYATLIEKELRILNT